MKYQLKIHKSVTKYLKATPSKIRHYLYSAKSSLHF